MVTAPSPLPTDDPQGQVARAGRVLALAGQGDLIWGHVSVRDAEGRGVWIKRRGIGFEETVEGDVHLVDPTGTVVVGEGLPHAEVHIHTQIMAERPDVNAVVHTHAMSAVLLAAAGQSIRPLTHEGTYFVPPGVPVFGDTGRMITSAELGRRVATTLGRASGLVLRNHGVVTVGADIPHAVVASLLLERAADAQLRVMHVPGQVTTSSPQEAQTKAGECYSPQQIELAWAYLVRGLGRERGGDAGVR